MRSTTMRELHLHIGMNKTGTTHVQACLPLNAERFAAHGFAMAPWQGAGGAHHEMGRRVLDAGPEAILPGLRAAPGDRLFASTEILMDVFNTPARAERFAAVIGAHFDIRIHLFLRRQDFLKESAFATVASFPDFSGTLGAEVHDPDIALPFDNPDFDMLLAPIEDIFGRAAISVAVYDDRVRGDPLAQLCTMMGIPAGGLVHPPRRLNVRRTRRRILAIAAAAKDGSAGATVFARTIHGSRFIRDDGGRFLLSPAARRRIVERYLDGNRRVVARHAPEGGDWLLTLPEDEPGWTPADPIRAREVLGVGLAALRNALRDRREPLWRRLRAAARIPWITAATLWRLRRRVVVDVPQPEPVPATP